MFRNNLIALVVFLFTFACASDPQPEPERVGPTHETVSAGLGDTRECADVRNASGTQLSDRLCLEMGGRIQGGHDRTQCDLCPLTAAERNVPHPPSGEPDCPGPRCEDPLQRPGPQSPRPLSDSPHDGPVGVHSF